MCQLCVVDELVPSGLASSFGSGSLMWLPSGCCTGYGHRKAFLRLEDPPPRWGIHMAVGRRPQLPGTRTSPQGCLSILMTWHWLPLAWIIRKRDGESEGTHSAFYVPSWKSHTVSFHYFCHIIFVRSGSLNTACPKGLIGREIKFYFLKAVDIYIILYI